MQFFESKSFDPYYNLALEDYFFQHADAEKGFLMLWQNDNTIVVGKYQNTAEEVNQAYVDEHSIKVARRLSGGGAVYHDKGNLNFTFIIKQKNIKEFDFNVFVVPLISALRKIGVKAEFTGRNDVTIDGKKISGNSQYLKDGKVLHHGCILFDSNLLAVSDALKPKDAKFISKSAKSVRSRVTTIKANVNGDISIDKFKSIFKATIAETNKLEEISISDSQEKEILQLRNEKYATWDWNYGNSPDYEEKKEKKFDAGLVTVYLNVKSGVITDIGIYGDFFGNGDISDLTEAIKGSKMNEEILAKLKTMDLNNYIKGLTAEELYDLLIN